MIDGRIPPQCSQQNRVVSGPTHLKRLDGNAFDIAMSNHAHVAFGAAARAVGFLGFVFYPRSGSMRVNLGPTWGWGEAFPVRAVPFVTEAPPTREFLAQRRKHCRRRDYSCGCHRGGSSGADRDRFSDLGPCRRPAQLSGLIAWPWAPRIIGTALAVLNVRFFYSTCAAQVSVLAALPNGSTPWRLSPMLNVSRCHRNRGDLIDRLRNGRVLSSGQLLYVRRS